MVGAFSEEKIEDEVKSYEGWRRVEEFGFLDRLGVAEVLLRSKAGLVTFHSVPNHIDAQPNKMFEYMSAGVPVIASNFVLWREVIEGNNCGLCVNPQQPKEIAEAIDYLLCNDVEAQRMGANGRKAVSEKYNWKLEEARLLELYGRFIN